MAKLQGHFLKYRNSIDEAIEKAPLLLEIEEQMNDMSIDEWLRRLNFPQYSSHLKKKLKLRTVRDLQYLQEGNLIECGMTLMTDRKRVQEMMDGNQDAKTLF